MGKKKKAKKKAKKSAKKKWSGWQPADNPTAAEKVQALAEWGLLPEIPEDYLSRKAISAIGKLTKEEISTLIEIQQNKVDLNVFFTARGPQVG
jgi:hypothetical protein